MIGDFEGMAKKVAKNMDKETTYKVAEIPKLMAKSNLAVMHSRDNARLIDLLKEMGYKIEESYIMKFESFSMIKESMSGPNIVEEFNKVKIQKDSISFVEFLDANWTRLTGEPNSEKDAEQHFPESVCDALQELGIDYDDFSQEWLKIREGHED